MYAIILVRGKQYRVQEGDVIEVDLLGSDQPHLTFDEVLLVQKGDQVVIGQPRVPQCLVHAELVGEVKGPKVIAYKFKPCKNSRRTVGHRQRYSRVKITKIAVG